MGEVLEFFQSDIVGQFLNPRRRLFWGYLISALIIAILWLCIIKKKKIRQALGTIFDRSVWLSKSSRADMVCFIINRIFMVICRPILITQIFIATALYHTLHLQQIIPIGLFETAPVWLSTLLFTSFFFLLDDFSRFALHLALHKVPSLWEFHKFHHSAETLTPLTVTRTHPVEAILFTLRSAIVQGGTIAIFIFLFGQQLSLFTILGVNVFVVLFHGLGSNLRHSHISVSYPYVIENCLMSPAQHHLHHSSSQKHFDKNFGVALSIWDKMAGSFMYSSDKKLIFGIGSETEEYTQTIAHMYFVPIKKGWDRLWRHTHGNKYLLRISSTPHKKLVNFWRKYNVTDF